MNIWLILPRFEIAWFFAFIVFWWMFLLLYPVIIELACILMWWFNIFIIVCTFLYSSTFTYCQYFNVFAIRIVHILVQQFTHTQFSDISLLFEFRKIDSYHQWKWFSGVKDNYWHYSFWQNATKTRGGSCREFFLYEIVTVQASTV